DREMRAVDCVNAHGELTQIPQQTFETAYLANKACDFITRRSADPETPWFLYLAPTAPHSPYRPEPQYADIPVPEPLINESNMPEADISDKPPYVHFRRSPAARFLRSDPTTWPSGGRGAEVSADGPAGWFECILNTVRPGMLRLLKSVDDMVDEVFATLEQTNQADNTL